MDGSGLLFPISEIFKVKCKKLKKVLCTLHYVSVIQRVISIQLLQSCYESNLPRTFLVALHGKKRISYFELKSIPRITISSKLFKLTSTIEEL